MDCKPSLCRVQLLRKTSDTSALFWAHFIIFYYLLLLLSNFGFMNSHTTFISGEGIEAKPKANRPKVSEILFK